MVIRDQAGTVLFEEEDELREETSDATGMQQRHKGLRPNRAAMSRKQEGIKQDSQADSWTGGHEVSRRDFHPVTGSE
jgi:hypothetical protein